MHCASNCPHDCDTLRPSPIGGRTSVRFRGQDDMIRHLGQFRQLGLRILCALALLGFAHKQPIIDAGPIPASEIADYILPDGTFPVLCLPSEDGTAKHDLHASPGQTSGATG